LAIKLDLKIIQIFSVRSHSFCICDRNFSLLGRKLAKIESIEIAQLYIDLINSNPNRSFELISEKVYDFDNFLMPYFKKINILKISKTVKIIYYPNGNISMCENYNENCDPICILDNDLTIIKNIDISKI
jgi:hypothetical protein